MALKFQARLVHAFSEALTGDAQHALPSGGSFKANFTASPAGTSLPRSTPEAEGLSSKLLAGFFAQLAAAPDANLHAALVLRHGKVVAEGYFSPYRKGVWHVTHSLCKSFTGTAVGLAIEEGLFGLDDSLAELFSDVMNPFNQKKWKDTTVRHLLTMSSGITFNELTQAVEKDWLKNIFSAEPAFPAGSKFVYNSINSYVLAALVCRTSGQTLSDFLQQRLYTPLQFSPVYWEKSPEGIEKGGWGMYLQPEDMAKLGQLYLQKGNWIVDGKPTQILSRQWVEEATKTQIATDVKENYGYHFWVDDTHNDFIMSGMFGQFVIGFPALDITLVMTAGNPDLFAESSAYTIVKNTFSGLTLPGQLPPAPAATTSLRMLCESLAYQAPAKEPKPPRRTAHQSLQSRWQFNKAHVPHALPVDMQAFCGHTWNFSSNRGGLLPVITQFTNNNLSNGVEAIHLRDDADHLVMFWEEGGITLSIPIGMSTPLECSVQIGGEQYLLSCKGQLLYNEDEHPILKILVCPLEVSSTRTLKLARYGDTLFLEMDEAPQLSVAIESAMGQSAATGKGDSGDFLSRFLLGSDYLHYRVNQVCRPKIKGHKITSTSK